MKWAGCAASAGGQLSGTAAAGAHITGSPCSALASSCGSLPCACRLCTRRRLLPPALVPLAHMLLNFGRSSCATIKCNADRMRIFSAPPGLPKNAGPWAHARFKRGLDQAFAILVCDIMLCLLLFVHACAAATCAPRRSRNRIIRVCIFDVLQCNTTRRMLAFIYK